MSLFGPPDVAKLEKKRNVTGLIKALSYKNDISVCIQAARALGKIGNSNATKPLVDALNHENESVRIASVRSLGQIGDIQAVVPLIDLLKKNSGDICDAVFDTLIMIGIPAIKPLSDALKGDYRNAKMMRKRIIFSLGEIGDSCALKPLVSALKQCNWDEREVLTEALEKIGWQPDDTEATTIYWVFKGELDYCVKISSNAVKPLLKIVKVCDDTMRKAVADVLVKIGDPAVEQLISALKHKDSNVRITAAQVLGKIGHKSAIDPLTKLLSNRDGDVGLAAFNAINAIGWENKEKMERVISLIKMGDMNTLEKLDFRMIRPFLIISLKLNISWVIKGRIAVMLNRHGMKLSDPRLKMIIKDLIYMSTIPDKMEKVLIPGERNDHMVERLVKSHKDERRLASEIIWKFKD
ncbi:MAG: HEAT repeat domain-containing protein, partial [Candidatus Aminicenantes bacterium]